MRQLSRKRWDKALALIAAALVIGLWLANEQPWRPALVVWCWGSSYEAQADFAREFGRRHRCKVVVVGGPAERLAVLAGASRRRADVFVAPAGPEWEWMRRQGLVTRGPEVFAFDPYVIVVPAGNPAGIKSEQDLGAGAYASIAPEAMWPKGKCIAALLDAIAAGLDAPWVPEAYYYAARSRVNDGRLLFRPLKQGKAYVTITQRSQTTLPEAKGLEVIDINPRFQVKMKGCSNTIAQCVGVLNGARRPEFAEAYADELLGAQAQELLSRHGFYHVADAKARPFRELRPDFVPYQPHEAQQRLAEELMADGLWDIALGEWLKLIHLFGPSPFDAKATYYAGYCAMQHGLKRGAAAMWRRCAQLYSRPRPKEWDLSIFAVGLRNPDTADTDERSWAEKARQALFSLGQEAQTEFGDDFNPDEPVTELFLQYPPAYIRVLDADLPDGSRRNLALAEDELLIGAYELALSDFNRVYTLRTPNSWSDMAMTKAGECAWLIGNKAAAISLWERCNTTYTGQTWGDLAGRMLYAASHDIETPSDKHLPPDAVSILEEEIVAPEAEGFVPRGLSLAAAEFQSRSLSGALTECLRIIHNFYSSSTARSETQRKLLREWQATAAYWAGIVCCWLAKPDAAVVQWQRAAKAYPGTPAAAKAQHALRTLQSYHGLSPAQRAAVQAALGAHGVAFASDPDRALAWQCLNDGVPDVSPVAIQRHVALELLCCGCWKEALAAFLGVLTSAVADGPNEGRWHDEALYFAGVCLERLGKTQRAQARWQELLRCFPRSEFAARAQKKLTGAAGARQEVGSRG